MTDPQTVFDGAARGDVNYVHYCLEANGEMISSTHGVERSTLLHVAGNNGNFDLMKVQSLGFASYRRMYRGLGRREVFGI